MTFTAAQEAALSHFRRQATPQQRIELDMMLTDLVINLRESAEQSRAEWQELIKLADALGAVMEEEEP